MCMADFPAKSLGRPSWSAPTRTRSSLWPQISARRDAQDGRIYGPGIGDNSTGVAGLLTVAETMQRLAASPDGRPPVDVWFVANSGEERLGDLKGMRAAVARLSRLPHGLGASIVIEGMGLTRIVHRALGSKRLRITAHAPGGHSWGDFGAGSAIHVLVRLAADLWLKVAKRRKPASTSGGSGVAPR